MAQLISWLEFHWKFMEDFAIVFQVHQSNTRGELKTICQEEWAKITHNATKSSQSYLYI